MPDVTQCPECQRKLNLPDGQLGQTVRCPACAAEFRADLYVEPRAAPSRPEPEPPRPAPRPSRDYDDRDEDRDYDRRPRRRPGGRYDRYARPGRGSTVQTLGILSLCFCWAMFGLVLGIVALVMASSDLAAMDRGEMDSTDRQATKTGQTFAIIGLIASGVLLFSCCGLGILGQTIR